MEMVKVAGKMRECFGFKVVCRGGAVEHFNTHAEATAFMDSNKGSVMHYTYKVEPRKEVESEG